MVNIKQLKQDYNKLLAREKKAETYLDNSNREESKKWAPEFKKIIVQLSKLMECYREMEGHSMTKEQILHGFREIES